MSMKKLSALILLPVLLAPIAIPVTGRTAEALLQIDLLDVDPNAGILSRVYGSEGLGSHGLPVAGGHDCDGDGLEDYAVASMQASPDLVPGAGRVHLIFGGGRLSGPLDTAGVDAGILEIIGAGPAENAGSEIWIDDVTGDGIGDLLIGRQNHTPDPNRIGAGALSVLVGGPALRIQAASLEPIRLAAPPAGITVTTFIGARSLDRLGMWFRTGDLTGDGIADLIMGADQEDGPGEPDRGAIYVVRGGAHLASGGTIDLAEFGATALAGQLARVLPPPGSAEFHFGATCQLADLDGNGRAELIVAAALSRAGGVLQAAGALPGSAHGRGGSPRGSVYIVWDSQFPASPWPRGFTFDVAATPAGSTTIHGGEGNVRFGEELLGGLDYDGDGEADLFIGDLEGDVSIEGNRSTSGAGHILYSVASLRGQEIQLDAPPAGTRITTFVGGGAGDIAADTAAHADFDQDGIDDLIFSSPHADPQGRADAGSLHVFLGQRGGWPARISLVPGELPEPDEVRIIEVLGAYGRSGGDRGDTLAYSAAVGDLDDDCRPDLITNEMQGNGISPGSQDTGNLIVLSGALLVGLRTALPGADGCGDVDDDGCVLGSDVLALRDHLADPQGHGLEADAQRRCDVAGEPVGCDLLDAVLLRRALHVPSLAPRLCAEAD